MRKEKIVKEKGREELKTGYETSNAQQRKKGRKKGRKKVRMI